MKQILHEQLQHLFMKMTVGSARKKIYALRAQQEGNSDLAALFFAISNSEAAQASRFLIQLRGHTGSNEENCAMAFEQEIPATIDAYEETAHLASDCRDKAMHGACSQSVRVQCMHLSLKKKLDKKSSQDAKQGARYHVCQFCGFIREDKAPENCPICTAPRSRFQEISA